MDKNSLKKSKKQLTEQANAFFKEKKYEEAIEIFKKIVTLTSENSQEKADLYNNIGCCYAHSKQWSNSKQYYDRALQIYTENFKDTTKKEQATIYNALQGVYYELGEAGKSLECIQKAQELDPSIALQALNKIRKKDLDTGLIKNIIKHKGFNTNTPNFRKLLTVISKQSTKVQNSMKKSVETKVKKENLVKKIQQAEQNLKNKGSLYKAGSYYNIATYYLEIEKLKEKRFRKYKNVNKNLVSASAFLKIAQQKQRTGEKAEKFKVNSTNLTTNIKQLQSQIQPYQNKKRKSKM